MLYIIILWKEDIIILETDCFDGIKYVFPFKINHWTHDAMIVQDYWTVFQKNWLVKCTFIVWWN